MNLSIVEKLEKMRYFYMVVERQFVNLTYTIPLDNKPETFSPELYSILHSACGQIEDMLRIICEQAHIRHKRNDDFPSYYKKLNVNGMLETQRVFLISKNKVVQPFIIKTRNTPDWWKGYNKTKHDYLKGVVHGNIGNTINALCALYALHHISYYAETVLPDELLKQENWYQSNIEDVKDPYLRQYLIVETERTFHSETLYWITRYNGKGGI